MIVYHGSLEIVEHPQILEPNRPLATMSTCSSPTRWRSLHPFVYPVASLGWMMYIGMAVAKLWDDEWRIYSQIEDLYAYLRDKRGYDALDEYICEDVLMLRGKAVDDLGALVGECAARVHHTLMHERIEPGTKEAFEAYVACLRQLYLFGMAVQLRRMGYHMERVR